MELTVIESPLSVIRIESNDPIPPWVWTGEFCSVTKTKDELSIFCDTQIIPQNRHAEVAAGWRAIRVVGTLALEVFGVISSLTFPLAAKQIGVFSISTHDTDYLVVPDDRLDDAVEALKRAGHIFV